MKVRLVRFILFFLSVISLPALCLEPKTNDQDLQQYLSGLSLEQKIGQLFMVGVLGDQISPQLASHIKKIRPGFLILFKKNIKTPLQTASFIYDLQNISYRVSKTQMLVAVDQEGGDVVRVPTSPPLPTALALGRSQDSENVFNIGSGIGQILKSLGIHINLAPVLDLSDPNKDSFLQTRSFGKNPRLVSSIAYEFSKGVESAGVLSTAKHFPGLGSINQDSHKELVENPIDKEELLSHYLMPYKELIEEKALSCIMMTHLMYPKIDPSLKPATFSSEIINLLKTKLLFKGLVMTDDIEMAGAKYFQKPEEQALAAFLAGNDVLMFAWNNKSQVKAYRGLLAAYQEGKISEERLNSSLVKILAIKKSLGLLEKPVAVNRKSIFMALRNPSLKIAVNSVFEKILTMEFSNIQSQSLSYQNMVVLSSSPTFLSSFTTGRLKRVSQLIIDSPSDVKKFSILLKKKDLIVVDVSGPKSSFFANNLPEAIKRKTLIVNSRFEGSIKDEDSFLAILQVSMKHPDLGLKIATWLRQKTSLRSLSGASSTENQNPR